MTIEEAQREVRTVFMHGSVGQAVSGAIWLLSASFSTWVSPSCGIWVLVLGGACIFPVTQLVLRLLGRPVTIGSANPLRWLAIQIAFTIPLNLPLAGAATMHRRGTGSRNSADGRGDAVSIIAQSRVTTPGRIPAVMG